MKSEVKRVYQNFLDALKTPELRILPGQIAFYFLMSFIPIIAIISLVASYISASFNLLSAMQTLLPDVLADILINLVNSSTIGNVAIIIGCYVLIGSNGPSAIIIASNAVYGVDQPNYFRLKAKSITMTLIIVLLFLFIIIIPLFGSVIIKNTLDYFSLSGSLEQYAWVLKVLKFCGSFIIIYLCVKLLYTLAPDKVIRSKHTTFGSFFTTISWIVSTEIFAFYITGIASYDKLYGNFANILILLIWIYFLAYIFVVGMAINVNRYQNKELKNEKGK